MTESEFSQLSTIDQLEIVLSKGRFFGFHPDGYRYVSMHIVDGLCIGFKHPSTLDNPGTVEFFVLKDANFLFPTKF